MITFFILNHDARVYIRTGISSIDFKYPYEDCLVVDRDKPEYIISYDEEVVRKLCESYDMKVLDPIHYGSWCGRRNFQSYQDFIVASKIR